MAVQYWVGGFFIDLSRNQITQNKQSQTLAPKALAVLTHLAENQGKVVSQDELLTKVWQNTAVTPNTLQKSIAQLRKALGEEGNLYIKTHAKQGYSLECDVRWQANLSSTKPVESHPDEDHVVADDTSNGDNSVPDSTLHSKSSNSIQKKLAPIAAIVLLVLLGTLAYQRLENTANQTSQLSFDQLRLLTATDDKEFDATYSPDGEYIVFHRYLDKQCINKIWAKNIATQKETLLTPNWGAYGRHSFSKDGEKMVFLATEPCNNPKSQTYCYDLVSLDFKKALESPQQPSVMLQCKNSIVKKPIWYGDDKIALLKLYSNRWKLISYSIDDNKSQPLYDIEDGNVIDFAYSTKRDLFAVTSLQNKGQHHVDMLDTDGRVISSHPIQRPQEIPPERLISANFTPSHEQLIFSTGKQLFTLSFEGKVNKISSPFSDSMMQPEFHPDGNKLLMIKGPYDSDVVKLSLNSLDQVTSLTQAKQSQSYTSLERTNLGEDYAIFQPGGDSIAFWSERSGESQIWLSNANGAKQMTRFPMDTYIRGFDWAGDGKSLLVNANNTLTQVYLDTSQKTVPVKHPVIRLYQWDSNKNTALMALRVDGKAKVVEYHFASAKYSEISDKTVLWALKTDDGKLIYKDNLEQFWQPGPVEDQRINIPYNQRSKVKGFIVNGNSIYAFNHQNQLWTYDLDNKTFKILGEFDKSVDYLTDVNETEMLMTIQVAAKKEVVELSVSE